MFNWHELNSKNFLSWMVVNLITGNCGSVKQDDALFDKLNEATNNFKEVDMKVVINGIELDTDYFVEAVQNNMQHFTEQAAHELLHEALPDFDSMQNIFDGFSHALKEKVASFADEHNLPFKLEEDYY